MILNSAERNLFKEGRNSIGEEVSVERMGNKGSARTADNEFAVQAFDRRLPSG
jgi:hypothetical protein